MFLFGLFPFRNPNSTTHHKSHVKNRKPHETASGHRTAASTTTADTDAGASAGAAAGDDDACDGGSFIVNRECEMSACCGGEIESTKEDRLNRE